MPRRINPKTFLAGARLGPTSKNQSQASHAQVKSAAKLVARCIQLAFEAAGCDTDREEDWRMVAMWLALAVFGGRDAGHPQVWSKRKLLKLVADIDKTKQARRAKGLPARDLDCCAELLKHEPYSKLKGRKDHLDVMTASGLRRRLVEARKAKGAFDMLGRAGAVAG